MGFILRITLFLLASAHIASAELAAFECKNSKTSAAPDTHLLDKVQAEYGHLQSIKASFLQDSYLSAMEIAETSSGTVWFKKPGKMKWDYVEPDKQTFAVKNEDVWYYQPAQNQVFVDNLKEVLISDIPVLFLMGVGNLKDDFKVERVCEATQGTLLDLTPLKNNGKNAQIKNEELKTFRLLVNRSYIPIGARVTDVGGNVTSILLSAVEQNVTLNDSVFALAYPQGTDIIDRRQVR